MMNPLITKKMCTPDSPKLATYADDSEIPPGKYLLMACVVWKNTTSVAATNLRNCIEDTFSRITAPGSVTFKDIHSNRARLAGCLH
jgi:hypothetical protein